MIEAVIYKPEGRGFDSLLRHRNFFYLRTTSGRNMTLESYQSVTKMSTRKIVWGVKVAGT